MLSKETSIVLLNFWSHTFGLPIFRNLIFSSGMSQGIQNNPTSSGVNSSSALSNQSSGNLSAPAGNNSDNQVGPQLSIYFLIFASSLTRYSYLTFLGANKSSFARFSKGSGPQRAIRWRSRRTTASNSRWFHWINSKCLLPVSQA